MRGAGHTGLHSKGVDDFPPLPCMLCTGPGVSECGRPHTDRRMATGGKEAHLGGADLARLHVVVDVPAQPARRRQPQPRRQCRQPRQVPLRRRQRRIHQVLRCGRVCCRETWTGTHAGSPPGSRPPAPPAPHPSGPATLHIKLLDDTEYNITLGVPRPGGPPAPPAPCPSDPASWRAFVHGNGFSMHAVVTKQQSALQARHARVRVRAASCSRCVGPGL